ncbi:MAG: N-acetyltransferase [Anaerolineae bacterium]|nr:N-acetyltransferase [Anaerolineae bacterium]
MSGNIIVTPVDTPEARHAFIDFQWEVYQNDPYWVPPLRSDCEKLLAHHPFHEHAKVRYFLARRDGKIVGRIAAIINPNHNHHWSENIGFFGLYEVLEDREASDMLLKAAEDFVRGEGLDAIRGPASFSTNEECGLLVDGWNGPPLIMMTYNPRYFVNFIEDAGYFKAQDLYAYIVDLTRYKLDGSGVNPKVLRVAEKVRQRTEINVRPINMQDFDAEATRFKDVYNAAWAKNWGFVPLTEAELEHEIMALRPVIDPATVFFAEKNGKTVGAMVPLPDLNQPLRRAYPRPGVPEWWTMLKFLYRWKVRRQVDTIRAFAGGVIEEYRGVGVDAVLFLETLLSALRQGYTKAEISWVLESNIPMRQTAENFDGEIYRTYRIYEKKLT